MAFGGYGSLMSAKMRKKPKDPVSGGDTGDDSVDASGMDEVRDMGSSSEGVNAAPEEGTETFGTGDSEPDTKDEGEGKELGSYDAVEDDAASELASLAGVPEDKRDAFKSALSDYVAACVRKQGK